MTIILPGGFPEQSQEEVNTGQPILADHIRSTVEGSHFVYANSVAYSSVWNTTFLTTKDVYTTENDLDTDLDQLALPVLLSRPRRDEKTGVRIEIFGRSCDVRVTLRNAKDFSTILSFEHLDKDDTLEWFTIDHIFTGDFANPLVLALFSVALSSEAVEREALIFRISAKELPIDSAAELP